MAREHTWPMWSEERGEYVEQLLNPCSLDRWTHWWGMQAHHIPLTTKSSDDAHLPRAWSLLFLLAHTSETILPLLPHPALYWTQVYEWAGKHCPGEHWARALQLVTQVREDYITTLMVPRKRGQRPGK